MAGATMVQFRYENFAGDRGTPLVGESWFDTTGNRIRVAKNGSTLATVRDTSVTIVNADIDAAAAIALSKLAVDPLARANHTGTQLAATISDFTTAVQAIEWRSMAQPTSTVLFNAQTLSSVHNINADGTIAASILSTKGAASGGGSVIVFTLSTDSFASVRLLNGNVDFGPGTTTLDARISRASATALQATDQSSTLINFRGADAVANSDFVTLGQLTSAQLGVTGLSVDAATTANITLSGTQTVDTRALVAGETCLVKNQTTPAQNGVYIVASGAWTRHPRMDAASEFDGKLVVVEDGAQAGTIWITVSEVTTLGTDPVTFSQFNSAADITASGGLTKTGNNIAISDAELLALAGLTSAADQLPYFNGSGTAALAAFGAAARNLLAATSAAQQRGVIAAGSAFTLLTGDGVATSWTITGATHALGTSYLGVTVLENLSGTVWTKIQPDFTVDSSNNNVVVALSHAPATNKLKIILHGGP